MRMDKSQESDTDPHRSGEKTAPFPYNAFLEIERYTSLLM